MNTKTVEQLVKPILQQNNLELYSVKTKREYGEEILEILIDAESISHEVLEPIHLEILDVINDLLPDHYLLEVSTVGLERPLNTLAEVMDQIGKYVYIKAPNFEGDATLVSVTDDNLEVSLFVKGKPTKLKLSYNTITSIRKAIKF